MSNPSGQNRLKTVWRSAFFVNSTLKVQCDIVKNTLLQTAFSAETDAEKGVVIFSYNNVLSSSI